VIHKRGFSWKSIVIDLADDKGGAMNRVRLRQNAFDRWIVVDVVNGTTAWRGSRFVPITKDGFPASDVQVSNLDTQEAAAEYAVSFGLK
jgi:hypothetical protein